MRWCVGENGPHEQRRSFQDVSDDRAGARRFDVEAQMSQLLLRLQRSLTQGGRKEL